MDCSLSMCVCMCAFVSFIREQSVRLVGHASAVTCLAIAHSDTWAVSGSEDTYLRVWNITRALPLCVSSNTRRSASTKTSPAPELPPDSNSLCVSILAGHSGGVTGLAITLSDRCACLLRLPVLACFATTVLG